MSGRSQRIRTPNKRYKEEDDGEANEDVGLHEDIEEEIQVEDETENAEELDDETGIIVNHQSGELSETSDPSIFVCHEEKPTYFYLDLIERAEKENLGVADNIMLPAAGTIIIFNIERYLANGRAGLDYEKIRRSMRVDGYRLFNAGTHRVAKSVVMSRLSGAPGQKMLTKRPDRVAFRSYNTLYNTRDPRKIDGRFKRKEYWYADGQVVLFHYIGDDDLAKRVAANTPHGNARRNFTAYVRTDPLILHEAREKMLAGEKLDEIYTSMKEKDPVRSIKNIKQLRNVKERIDQERKRKATAFYNIHSLYDLLKFEGTRQPFLHNITAIRVVAHLFCEPLLEEFINTANLNSNETSTQIIFYDTTFSSCGFQIGLLSFRHDIFDEDPPVPLAFLVGEALTPKDHSHFFETLVECFPRLKNVPMALASTVPVRADGFWPELMEVRAWNDAKFQLKRELIHGLHRTGSEWRSVMRIFEELTLLEDEEAFDKKWEAVKGRLDEDVVEVMTKTTIPEWKALSSPWSLEEKGIRYKESRGVSRVPIGSFEYMLCSMNEAKLAIDGLVACLFYLCQFTINEMERGYYQLGSFTIKEMWYSLTDDPANIPRQPFAPYPDEVIQFVNEVALNTTFPLAKRKRLSQGLNTSEMRQMHHYQSQQSGQWSDGRE